MRYDTRNRATLKELAPHTQAAAQKWYDYCVKQGIEILITDARRSITEQRANVARGASKTMRSYHLVGQALDFVPILSNGKADWRKAAYFTPPISAAIAYAKTLGFHSGRDWPGSWDCPHLEYRYRGYGSDKAMSNQQTYLENLVQKGSAGEKQWAQKQIDAGRY